MSERATRVFDDEPCVRTAVPLLVGIDGCSSSGKTFSALRLATGMQRVYGGDIRLIDADSGRGKHYADMFKYRRVPFDPPFGSLDFLEAITQTIAKGGIVIVDHMSAEHDGEGGLLDTQEEAKKGKDSRNAVAWKLAKGLHHQLVRAIQQIKTPVILLWRAADKLDWKTGGEPKKLGMMPIGSKDLIFEMTVNAYLPPAAKGVPSWNPTEIGEQMMTKLPIQFRDVFQPGEALCEAHGEAMARWAIGKTGSARAEAMQSRMEKAGSVEELDKARDEFVAQHKQAAFSKQEYDAIKKAGVARRAELARSTPQPQPGQTTPKQARPIEDVAQEAGVSVEFVTRVAANESAGDENAIAAQIGADAATVALVLAAMKR